jgi:hypothetical protein
MASHAFPFKDSGKLNVAEGHLAGRLQQLGFLWIAGLAAVEAITHTTEAAMQCGERWVERLTVPFSETLGLLIRFRC